MTLATSAAKIPEAKEKFRTFMRELTAWLEDGEAEQVYELSIQLFPLSVNAVPKKRKHKDK